MEGANYWKKMEEASEAAGKLRKLSSARDIRQKILKAEQTVTAWGKNIEKQRVTYRNRRNKAARQAFGKLMDDAIRSSGGSSSSSSSNHDSSEDYNSSSSSTKEQKREMSISIDIENISMPDYTWISEWDISSLDRVIGTEDVAWSTRKIRWTKSTPLRFTQRPDAFFRGGEA